jgi:hypothetical protein
MSLLPWTTLHSDSEQSPLAFFVRYWLNVLFSTVFKVQVLALGALESQFVSYFSPGKATGEIHQRWEDKIAALPTFLIHLELNLSTFKKLQVEIINRKYQHSACSQEEKRIYFKHLCGLLNNFKGLKKNKGKVNFFSPASRPSNCPIFMQI